MTYMHELVSQQGAYRKAMRFFGLLVLVSTCIGGNSAEAANDSLQSLFFLACLNPSANLAVRCAETVDDEGDLSGDSETSLNPTQVLSSPAGCLRLA